MISNFHSFSSNSPAAIIKEKVSQAGGQITVHSLSGKVYQIFDIPNRNAFQCDQLPINPPYSYDVFNVIVNLLIQQGGKARKGLGRNAKLGEPNCEITTVVGAIGKYYAGHNEGDSVFDPVFVLASILDWADIAYNKRGYLELTPNYKQTDHL